MRSFRKIGRINIFLKDPNKKGFFKMAKEVLTLWVLKKEFPFYYFKYVYRKHVTNYKDYLSTKEVVKIGLSKKLHNPIYNQLIENKLSFSLFAIKNAIKTPKLISYNTKTSFFYNNITEQITTKVELIHFFEKVFAQSNIEELFFRPPSDYGGKGCFKLTKKNLTNELEDKVDNFLAGTLVHNEVIKQHETINKIHKKAVSTLRLITLITPENKTEIMGCFIRFGVGDNVVDNASSGGVFVGVNLEDGTLKKTGHYFPEHGGAEITKHPDSGFEFEGFKIPFYKEACDAVINAVKIIPDRFIGWDVAITQNGPLIVESNAGPHLPGSDIAYGGFLQNKHWKNLLNELNE